MLGVHLYLLQRISALVMAPLVLIHLAVMIYAVRGGLSSAEILARTQGNFGWMAFYGLFVVAVSIHAAIGLRVVAFEWCKIHGSTLNLLTLLVLVLSLVLGGQAVIAVTL